MARLLMYLMQVSFSVNATVAFSYCRLLPVTLAASAFHKFSEENVNLRQMKNNTLKERFSFIF